MAQVEQRRGYHPNHSMEDGLGGFMMDPRKTGKVAMQAARTVARRAKMLVERDSADGGGRLRDAGGRFQAGDGKSLADSFEVHQTVVRLKDGENSNPRLSAIVVNQARHAARWEFGISSKGHKGAHRSLRRAGASVGELRGGIG